MTSEEESVVKIALVHLSDDTGTSWIACISDFLGTLGEKIINKGSELVVFSQRDALKAWTIESLDRKAVPVSMFKSIAEEALEIKSAEFQQLLNLSKEISVHIMFPFTEKSYDGMSIFQSQCIISKDGVLALIRRDTKLSLVHNEVIVEKYYDGYDCPKSTVISLSYKSGVYETGCLFICEHFKPLMVQNSTTQFEKIHLVYIGPMHAKLLRTNCSMESLFSSYSQQTQSFGLLCTSDRSLSCLFNPDGSKAQGDTAVENNHYVTNFDLHMKKITIQKSLIDPIGHSSRPDAMSLNIIDRNISYDNVS